MTGVLLVSIEIAILAWIIQTLMTFARAKMTGGREQRTVPIQEVRELMSNYGQNSNSFLTLYPGFQYFKSSEGDSGVIAYVETDYALVAAAEPLAAIQDQVRLLEEFSAFASQRGKRTLLLPADLDFATRATQSGFGALMIGSEPTFDLKQYPPAGQDWQNIVASAKQLAARGTKVYEFSYDKLSEEKRAGMDKMVEDWFGTRKTAALEFLNQVHPWLHSKDKKYFAAELNGKILAFVAGIPIPARKGWYLIDTIRTPESPNGATELLLIEAIKQLKAQGYEEVTMGVAPLAKVTNASSIEITAKKNRFIYKVMNWIFEKGNLFYNFGPLFAYKMKFNPTLVRPVFLLYRSKTNRARLSMADLVSISQAWLPKGMTHAAGTGVLRLLSNFSLPDLIKSQLRNDLIVRSVPPNWGRLLFRCRWTFAIVALNIVAYAFSTDISGRISRDTASEWGFSWPYFLAHPAHAMILSPFLHNNAAHLMVNIFAIVVFMGGLEYLGGSLIAGACCLVPMLFANPITSFVAVFALKPIFPTINESVVDVGASLGAFGSVGGLYWFLRDGKYWLTVALLIVIAAFIAGSWNNDWILLNHCTALLMGLLVGRLILRD